MDELKIDQYIIGILIALTVWVLFLSFFLFKAVSHYKGLAQSANIKDLGKILDRIIARGDLQSQEIVELRKSLANQKEIALGHISKYSLIRFNPFEESGGDQSFTVALLDNKNNGIIFSSLHSRSGTRIYAKEVVGAHAPHNKLSKEEKEAVEKAARQK